VNVWNLFLSKHRATFGMFIFYQNAHSVWHYMCWRFHKPGQVFQTHDLFFDGEEWNLFHGCRGQKESVFRYTVVSTPFWLFSIRTCNKAMETPHSNALVKVMLLCTLLSAKKCSAHSCRSKQQTYNLHDTKGRLAIW